MLDKKSFTTEGFGWMLEKTNKFFLGKEIHFYIETKIDSEDPDREIFDEQMETLNMIYSKWEAFCVIIEKEILDYEKIAKEELIQILDSPHVWLSMDLKTDRPEKDNKWSFVVEAAGENSIGWHVEFEGEEHVDTWAGG